MLHKIKEIWLVIFHTLFGSVRRWQHMLRYTSESLESNLWCLLNLNFNTGNPAQFSSVKSFIYLFYTWWLYHIANPLTCSVVYLVFTGRAKPKQSSQQPSSPAVPGKQAGVREEGFCYCWTELAWLLTPVIVRVWTVSSPESRNHRSRKQLISQK